MILKGFVQRLTEDVDIIAVAQPSNTGNPTGVAPPDPLPAALLRAASRVARDFDLAKGWMNSAVGAQWETGLPPGFSDRIRWSRFGGLTLGVADRLDLIFLKLYAAVDSEGPESVHYQDLLALRPESEELAAAVEWVNTQDTSAEFATMLVCRSVNNLIISPASAMLGSSLAREVTHDCRQAQSPGRIG